MQKQLSQGQRAGDSYIGMVGMEGGASGIAKSLLHRSSGRGRPGGRIGRLDADYTSAWDGMMKQLCSDDALQGIADSLEMQRFAARAAAAIHLRYTVPPWLKFKLWAYVEVKALWRRFWGTSE